MSSEAAQQKARQSSSGSVQSSVWATNASSRIMPADRLTCFHRRMNKVLLDTVALNKEKERLESENAKLQDLISQYISGTRIDETSLRGDNPLFVVNGRSNLSNPLPVRFGGGNVQMTIQDERSVLNFAK